MYIQRYLGTEAVEEAEQVAAMMDADHETSDHNGLKQAVSIPKSKSVSSNTRRYRGMGSSVIVTSWQNP